MTLRNNDKWQALNADNYYTKTANAYRYDNTLLTAGEHRTDVAIIGAGFSGLSAALELAHKGYRVRVLEAKTVGWGASGRNGGQILPSYGCGQSYLEKQLGLETAKMLFDISTEAQRLIKERIAQYHIACDYQSGYYGAAIKPRTARELFEEAEHFQKHYGYSMQYIEGAAVREHIDSPRYVACLKDDLAGHMHPLNYALGLADACALQGVQLHEHAEVLRVIPSPQGKYAAPIRLKTAKADILCDHLLLAGNCILDSVVEGVDENLTARIMPVGTYIGATAPLLPDVADTLVKNRSCVCDNQFVLDYFRVSADHRLLFGGLVSYTTHTPFKLKAILHKGMMKVFPQLASVPIEYAWGGFVDITLSRAPDFGRFSSHPNIYYLQGFSGHGVALTGMAGKLVAEAIAGSAERFDVFGRIKHRHFPGGKLGHAPLYALGMLYSRLKDLL